MAAVAHEQVGAEGVLELLDLVAQRRLGDVEARGSSAEVELFRDGQEVAQQARLEVDSPRLTIRRDTGLGQEPPPDLASNANTTFANGRQVTAMSSTTVTSLDGFYATSSAQRPHEAV
jgi:hypothetical protein